MQPSSVMENGTVLNTTEVEWNPGQIEWNEEISLEEAKALLEKAMYPFKKVGALLAHLPPLPLPFSPLPSSPLPPHLPK